MFGKIKKETKMSIFWLTHLKKMLIILSKYAWQSGKVMIRYSQIGGKPIKSPPEFIWGKSNFKIEKRIVPEGGESHGSSAEGGGKEQTIEYQHWSYLLTKKAWMIFKHQATRNANRKQKQSKQTSKKSPWIPPRYPDQRSSNKERILSGTERKKKERQFTS